MCCVCVLCDRCRVKGWRIRSACCNDCQAGKHTGFCHHIVVGLEGLVSILSGLIVAGEVNAGKMHWGLKQSNDTRHHVPTILLNILAGNECMTTYKGSHKHFFESCMNAFNMDVFEQFGPKHPPLMTQELYTSQLRTFYAQLRDEGQQLQSQSRTKRKCKGEGRVEGGKRRRLHQDLVSDQCSFEDSIDLRRSVNDIKHIVEKSSPNSLRKIQHKERKGKSRKTLFKIIQKRERELQL